MMATLVTLESTTTLCPTMVLTTSSSSRSKSLKEDLATFMSYGWFPNLERTVAIQCQDQQARDAGSQSLHVRCDSWWLRPALAISKGLQLENSDK